VGVYEVRRPEWKACEAERPDQASISLAGETLNLDLEWIDRFWIFKGLDFVRVQAPGMPGA
jgi:hypothetical protein